MAAVRDQIEKDFRPASPPNSFVTKLKLWLPDEESPWGQRLHRLFRLIGARTVRVPEGFSCAKRGGLSTVKGKALDSQIKFWRKALPNHPPSLVLAILTNKFAGPCSVRVLFSSASTMNYCVIINDGATPLAVGRRLIRLDEKYAFHNLLQVDRNQQGKGLAGRLLVNAVYLYNVLNIAEIRIVAGLSAGGAVWPKFGFHPESAEEWQGTHATIRAKLAKIQPALLAKYKTKTGVELADVLENLFSQKDPAIIWSISDLDKTGIKVSDPTSGTDYNLGTFLLRGTRWKGILSLADRDVYTRFADYVREKRY